MGSDSSDPIETVTTMAKFLEVPSNEHGLMLFLKDKVPWYTDVQLDLTFE